MPLGYVNANLDQPRIGTRYLQDLVNVWPEMEPLNGNLLKKEVKLSNEVLMHGFHLPNPDEDHYDLSKVNVCMNVGTQIRNKLEIMGIERGTYQLSFLCNGKKDRDIVIFKKNN